MHSDLSSHLHSEECNGIIAALYRCRQEHPYGKFFGACNDIDFAMTKCLKKEKTDKKIQNLKLIEERRERRRKRMEEERLTKLQQEMDQSSPSSR